MALLWSLFNKSMFFLYWWLQCWTQHPKCGLTRAEQRCRIPSLTLLATLLPKQPRTGLAFWAAGRLLCRFHPPVLQILFIRAALNLFPPYLCWYRGMPWPICRALTWLMRSMQAHFSRVFSKRSQWSNFINFFSCTCSFSFRMLCKWILWQLSFQHWIFHNPLIELPAFPCYYMEAEATI